MTTFIIVILCSILLNSCNSQSSENHEEASNGIVYFSHDNGYHWINSSISLPAQISIGLGGIATSSNQIGIASKENGVYLYNFQNKNWESIQTEKRILDANLGALAITDSIIFVGTQFQGVFYTQNNGATWTNQNNGLQNLTIRRFCEFNNILYACTNDGFYSYDKVRDSWQIEYRQNALQTNGATRFKGKFYLATNQGIFSQQADKSWVNTSPQLSMHNISSDQNLLYAMTYNEMLLSSNDGSSWVTQQNGLPKSLYTFNVITHNDVTFAGQWDGIYKKTNIDSDWEISSNGLPRNYAVTNLKSFNDIIIISTSERKSKTDINKEK